MTRTYGNSRYGSKSKVKVKLNKSWLYGLQSKYLLHDLMYIKFVHICILIA